MELITHMCHPLLSTGSMTVLIVDVDSASIENTSVECTFEPEYSCTIDYGTNTSFTNLNYRSTTTTSNNMTTITLSQGIEINTTYYFIVTAESNSQCARVRGSFQTSGYINSSVCLEKS